MDIKRIKCPSCGVVLDVKNPTNEAVKFITCPRCRAQLKVNFAPAVQQPRPTQPPRANTGETQYITQNQPAAQPQPQPRQQPAATSYGETQFGNFQGGSTQFQGGNAQYQGGNAQRPSPQPRQQRQPSLLFNGVSYPLRTGNNIVGRQASTSQATVQIATIDRFMSRSHVTITVSQFPDGTGKAVLSNYHNKNMTWINGTPIQMGEGIVLSPGDRITMGETTVEFQLR